MNRVKSILAVLKRRSLPLRGEQSWFAPGFGMALIVLSIPWWVSASRHKGTTGRLLTVTDRRARPPSL